MKKLKYRIVEDGKEEGILLDLKAIRNILKQKNGINRLVADMAYTVLKVMVKDEKTIPHLTKRIAELKEELKQPDLKKVRKKTNK